MKDKHYCAISDYRLSHLHVPATLFRITLKEEGTTVTYVGSSATEHIYASPRYMAPELLRGYSVKNEATDTFAFGMLCHEVCVSPSVSLCVLKRCSLKVLSFDAISPQVSRESFIMLGTLKGVRPSWSDQLQQRYSNRCGLIKLAEKCWAQNPLDRPGMTVVSLQLRSIITAIGRRPACQRRIPSEIGCNDPSVFTFVKRKERGDPDGNLRASKRLRPNV